MVSTASKELPRFHPLPISLANRREGVSPVFGRMVVEAVMFSGSDSVRVCVSALAAGARTSPMAVRAVVAAVRAGPHPVVPVLHVFVINDLNRFIVNSIPCSMTGQALPAGQDLPDVACVVL